MSQIAAAGACTTWMDEQRIVPFGLVGDSGSAITLDSGFVLSNIRLRAAAVCLRPALCGEPGLRRRKTPLCACARVASGDMTIRIWEIATGACVATLEGHRGSVRSLALLNGTRLASGSSDQTVKVWEVATGECLATLRLADTVLAIAPIPTSTAIAVASGNSISIHNLESLDSR